MCPSDQAEMEEEFLGGLSGLRLGRGWTISYGLYATSKRLIGISQKRTVYRSLALILLGILALAGLFIAIIPAVSPYPWLAGSTVLILLFLWFALLFEVVRIRPGRDLTTLEEVNRVRKDLDIPREEISRIEFKSPTDFPGHIVIERRRGNPVKFRASGTKYWKLNALIRSFSKKSPEIQTIEVRSRPFDELGDFDRGIEAGAASGFTVAMAVWAIFVVGTALFSDYWLSLQIHPLIVVSLVILFDIVALVAFGLAGPFFGAIASFAFTIGFTRIHVKQSGVRGFLLGLSSLPVFTVFVWALSVITVSSFLEKFVANLWLPGLVTGYGGLFGYFWKGLDKPGKKTYLRRLDQRYPRLLADAVVAFFLSAFVASMILAPFATRLGYTGPLPRIPTNPSDLLLIGFIVWLLASAYFVLGRVEWIEERLIRFLRRNH